MWLLEEAKDLFTRIANSKGNPFKRVDNAYIPPDVIIRDSCNYLSPFVRRELVNCSILEDKENSYYSGILNTLANHCVGTTPIPVCLVEDEELADAIEDKWVEYCMYNEVGAAIREFRRKAALTGIAVAIPIRLNSTPYEVKLGFQILGAEHLATPYDADPDLIIEDGVEYYPTGEIKGVWVKQDDAIEPLFYSASVHVKGKPPVIVWSRRRAFKAWPECAPAFTVYPSIRRYLTNVIRGAEFRTSIPAAIELDPQVYPTAIGSAPPKGAFKYEPGMIPTLPPGTKLTQLNITDVAEDRIKFMDLLVSTAARCIDMPRNLALASSSDSNMATAHIDLQPWKYVVDIDRFDFEVVIRKMFYLWYSIASLHPSMPEAALKYEGLMGLPVLFNYTVLFDHPDPGKKASARETDLKSGASTLTRIYADQGKTARREIQKECKLLGITPERYYELILQTRVGKLNNAQADAAQGSQGSQEQQKPQPA